MHNLSVQIVRFVDHAFPGWVECEFLDAEGRLHVVRDKVPMFTTQVSDENSVYPRPGEISCEILGKVQSSKGEEAVRIVIPGAESTEGTRDFVVPGDLVR